ncbi:AAA family ATPase [Bifidobacterium longum]|uniref:AAA family ATPase n=1 Tax=Bifidobacterium longum TaxID=216816 RepID=UPI00190F1952|nr:AAA family ATPase [Bifidobacterium longum]MBV4156297.1 AAA family ATPase [Bifidobacterium longum]MBV4158068.1 AAA family ATPase [Bifidobacterium longum]MBV4162131.1 AAA family ATPase [Bifidobacterium longum]MBV4165923.1 AAA family ATPase [Bifidobacterium longum]
MAYTRRRARPSHYGILEANPSSRTQGTYLFLDEVQEAEHWQGFCQRLAEHERVTLVVTVSSSKLSSEQAFLCYELNEYTTSLKPDTTAVPKSLCGRSGTGLRRFTCQSTGCRQTIGNRSLSRIASTSIRQTHRFHYLADLAHL